MCAKVPLFDTTHIWLIQNLNIHQPHLNHHMVLSNSKLLPNEAAVCLLRPECRMITKKSSWKTMKKTSFKFGIILDHKGVNIFCGIILDHKGVNNFMRSRGATNIFALKSTTKTPLSSSTRRFSVFFPNSFFILFVCKKR